LESCIKLTSEPPRGIRANLHMALDHFDQEALEQCSREAEFKTLLFALCYFHAVVTERRHFGAQGWNRTYPFSAGDLTISVNVLLNYIESSGSSGRVPWEDLRYLLGEIMYGGHVTDDWDRRLCRAYLEELLQPDLLDGELLLAPNFPAPPNRDYAGYQRYIDEFLPPESTYLYGLHPVRTLISFQEIINYLLLYFICLLECGNWYPYSKCGSFVSRTTWFAAPFGSKRNRNHQQR